MTVVIQNEKESNIKLYQKHNFITFPIKKGSKGADFRYDAERTKPNQPIRENENWGVVGTLTGRNGTIDFDDKERFREFAELKIKDGYKVIESPHGWHIPFVGIKNTVTKMELHNYKVQQDKLIEIQGYKHYCVGVGSWVHEDKKDPNSKLVTYNDRGSNKFWNLENMDYNEFVDMICKECNVTTKKKNSNSSYKNLRDKFIKGQIPSEGQSNDYFFEAGKVCNSDGLSQQEALERIRPIYDEWQLSEFASDRPWSNIETKVNEVYEKNLKVRVGKPTISKGGEVDRTGIALRKLEKNEYYSDKKTGEVYQNKNGFLELINYTLGSELFLSNPEVMKADISEILEKIKNGAMNMPNTNKDMIVFPNGTFDSRVHKIIETDEIADMGFNQYNYLPKTKENEPKEFLKFFESYKKSEHPRLKAGLRSIFTGYHDSRISVLHGINRVGKTTILSIICKILGKEYAYSVDLDIFLSDRATMSEIIGKRFVVFQDLPEKWKYFTMIKNITGESQTNIRKFNQKSEVSENKIKIFATANKLPDIKESQKNTMYSARLSLIHNIEKKQFPENEKLEDRIIETEAEKIISWIINLSDEECKYENKDTVRKEWEELASPQVGWLESNYKPSTSMLDRMVIIELCNEFKAFSENSMEISIEQMTISLKTLGYSVHDNVVKNILSKPKPKGFKHTDNS